MSKTSTPSPEQPDKELIELLGGGDAAPIRDEEAEEIADALGTIRRQLLATAKEEGVSAREIARRLGVSVAAVSRQLRSDRDLRISTAVLIARALKRHWSLQLEKTTQPAPRANVRVLQSPAPFSRLEERQNDRTAAVLSVR